MLYRFFLTKEIKLDKRLYLIAQERYIWGVIMEIIKDHFLCDSCKNKDFIKIYNFSLQFRRVNFSDKLIYDEVIEERYQCTHCHKIFSKQQIEARLKEIIDERRTSLPIIEK
jgi:hypothetical protein